MAAKSIKVQVLYRRNTKVFFPGDSVSGHVVITGPVDEEKASVDITFVGRAKTKLDIYKQYVPYTDSQHYFSFQKCLYEGHVNIEGRILSYMAFQI